MKKQIFFLFLLSLFSSGLFGDSPETDNKLRDLFQSKVLDKSLGLKDALATYKLQKIDSTGKIKFYFPTGGLSLSPVLKKEYGFESGGFSMPIGFNLVQNLPWFSTFTFTLNQNIDFNDFGKEYSYSFSGCAALQTSMAVFNSSFAKDYYRAERNYLKNLKTIYDLNFLCTYKGLVAEYLIQIARWLYFSEISKLYEEKYNLYSERSKDNLILFQRGHITSLELSESEKETAEIFSSYLQVLENKFELEAYLITHGIESKDLNFSLTEWIDFLENISRKYSVFEQNKMEVELMEININYKNNLKNRLSDIPSLNFAYSLNPDSNSGNNLKKYWANMDNFNWSFSVYADIPLTPWNGLYTLRKSFALEKESYNIRLNRFYSEKENEIIIREKKLEMYSVLEEKNNRHFIIEQERMKLFSAMLESGRISDLDCRIQTNIARESFLNYCLSKINRIEYVLGFF